MHSHPSIAVIQTKVSFPERFKEGRQKKKGHCSGAVRHSHGESLVLL